MACDAKISWSLSILTSHANFHHDKKSVVLFLLNKNFVPHTPEKGKLVPRKFDLSEL